jgi:hypothetical protein
MLTMADQEQKNYYYKVNAEYAEAMYQKMASIRYGIDFCCTPDLTKWSIKKDLLDMNNAMDSTCPNPDNIPPVETTCYVFKATAPPKIGGTVVYVPCGSTEPVTVELSPFIGDDKYYGCYDASTEIITTGGVNVISEGILCNDDNKVCITLTFTLESPSIEGTTSSGSVSGVDCNGDSFSFDETLVWNRVGYSWTSPPTCVNLNETTDVQGAMEIIVGETCT